MFEGAAAGFSFIYIILGLVTCFWGYRIFRIVLGIVGFITGAYIAGYLTSRFTGGLGIMTLIAGLAGGLILGSVFVTLYMAGVFILGATAGWLFGFILTNAADRSLHIILFIILALSGGILAVLFQRMIVIVSTAMIGAWYMVAGGFALMGSGYTPMAMFEEPGSLIVFADGPGLVILICWFALALSGVFFQYRYGNRSRE